jgi:hypothetical protein
MCYQGACILFSVGFWFAIPTFGRPPLLTPHAPLPTHRPLSYRNPQAIAHVLSVLTSTGKADKLKGFELVKAVHLDHQWVRGCVNCAVAHMIVFGGWTMWRDMLLQAMVYPSVYIIWPKKMKWNQTFVGDKVLLLRMVIEAFWGAGHPETWPTWSNCTLCRKGLEWYRLVSVKPCSSSWRFYKWSAPCLYKGRVVWGCVFDNASQPLLLFPLKNVHPRAHQFWKGF